MKVQSREFPQRVDIALKDETLRTALEGLGMHVSKGRELAIRNLPEFEQLRVEGQAIRDHTLEYLDLYLEKFEAAVKQSGGQVHWAQDGQEACRIIGEICQHRGAHKVVKGKSMVSEEIELNAWLESLEITPIETDLGEYIIQLRGEKPSHLTAPAMHVSREQVAATFDAWHGRDEPRGDMEGPGLLKEARVALRKHFMTADVGITGANFCIAETGSTVIVTNEGNGDLSQNLPPVHIVLAGIEKIVPTLEDTCTLTRLLTRSASGQECSVYVTFSTGPRRAEDTDGPEEFHVVLLDNGRSAMLNSPFRDILRCIRCGACQNACPVYQQIGGHAYGSTYSGPLGAVLTPGLAGIGDSGHLPNASTFCGRCAEVCPVKIPLPDLMRTWREQEFDDLGPVALRRWGLNLWAWLARHPSVYRKAVDLFAWWLHRQAAGKDVIKHLPLPWLGNWTRFRDFPTPAKSTFISQYRNHGQDHEYH